MEPVVGVKDPYGLVQKAGRKRRTRRTKRRTMKNRTRRMRR